MDVPYDIAGVFGAPVLQRYRPSQSGASDRASGAPVSTRPRTAATMDSSTKPVKKNPRKGAFCLSQLFFGWLLPLFYRGSRRGLGKDDLTKCLKADRSEDLGDELEE